MTVVRVKGFKIFKDRHGPGFGDGRWRAPHPATTTGGLMADAG